MDDSHQDDEPINPLEHTQFYPYMHEMYHENEYDASHSCQKILGADEFTSTATVFAQQVNGHYKNFLSNRLLHFT